MAITAVSNSVTWADYYQFVDVTFGQEVVMEVEMERDDLAGPDNVTVSMSYEDFDAFLAVLNKKLSEKYGKTQG